MTVHDLPVRHQMAANAAETLRLIADVIANSVGPVSALGVVVLCPAEGGGFQLIAPHGMSDSEVIRILDLARESMSWRF